MNGPQFASRNLRLVVVRHECCTIDAMAQWLTLEQGLKATGLRIAPVRNAIPSPWSELCRALFRVKRIPFALIDARDLKRGLADLKAATGHETLPVLFSGSERPLASWLDQILFAERMASAPRLLPSHPQTEPPSLVSSLNCVQKMASGGIADF